MYSSYVQSTWERGGRGLSYTEHCATYHARLDRIVASGAIVLVVVDDEAPGWCGGWAAANVMRDSRVACHWTYVRSAYRRSGLCKLLLTELGRCGSGMVATGTARRWATMMRERGITLVPLALAMEGRHESDTHGSHDQPSE